MPTPRQTIPIQLTKTEVYDLCDALTTEAERYAGLAETRIDAPTVVRSEWLQRAISSRNLSRRLISECFSGRSARAA